MVNTVRMDWNLFQKGVTLSLQRNVTSCGRSTYLSSCDYFYQEYLKAQVLKRIQQTYDKLKDFIPYDIAIISETMTSWARQNFTQGLQEYIIQEDKHLTWYNV